MFPNRRIKESGTYPGPEHPARQTASVSTGLPFALVLLVGVYSLYVGFTHVETMVERAVKRAKEEHRVLETVSNVIQSETEKPPDSSG